MRYFVLIVSVPNEINPGSVEMVIKFTQLFKEEGIILESQI
jgi:hypothetical protein